MREFKTYIISILFILGLLVSPKIYFEEKVDTTLKFESGLLIKKDLAKGVNSLIINPHKTSSKTNLDFILSDHRFVTFKFDNILSQNHDICLNNNVSQRYNYYLNRLHKDYKIAKTIYQLQSIII
jgi:hypothetical protein